MTLTAPAPTVRTGGEASEVGGIELQASPDRLASYIAAGDTLDACAEAAGQIGASQIDEDTLKRLAKTGVSVRRVSPDGISQQVLTETASEAGATLPVAKGPGGQLQQLHADLFSLDRDKAKTARQVLAGYAPAIAETFAGQAGRALIRPLDQTRSRAVLVQPDGSILVFGVNKFTSRWARKVSTETRLLTALAEHGIQTDEWKAEGTENNPFAKLLTGRWLPRSKAKGTLSAPDWEPPQAPSYDDSDSKVDRAFDETILATHTEGQITNDSVEYAKGMIERAVHHPGAIAVRGIRSWLRNPLHAMPVQMDQIPGNWAMDGRVSLHMVEAADAAQRQVAGHIAGRLVTRAGIRVLPLDRPGDMAVTLGKDPLIAAQVYDLATFQKSLPVEGADMPLAELLTAFHQAQAEKSFTLGAAAAVAIAAMATKGFVFRGGVNPKTIDMVLANAAFNGTASEGSKAVLASRRQAAAFRKAVNKYRETPTIDKLTGAIKQYAMAARAARKDAHSDSETGLTRGE